MDISHNKYEEAATKLAYIKKVNELLCSLLLRLAHYSESNMLVGMKDYTQAAAYIKDAIEEMFYTESHTALLIKEEYERGREFEEY